MKYDGLVDEIWISDKSLCVSDIGCANADSLEISKFNISGPTKHRKGPQIDVLGSELSEDATKNVWLSVLEILSSIPGSVK